uniref:Uncharacterized protein n=1 Tax=Chrysotila carterae TaxID=13221 RepID=A0A7S4B066_CHRCT
MARSDAASALSAETLSTAGQRDQSHFVAWRCGARLSPERVVMLVAALDAAEAALVAASFPAWQRQFGFGPAQLGVINSCQTFAAAAMLPAWGFLLPWLGFRRSLLIAVSTWALTTLLSTIDLDAIAGLASGFSITTAYFSDAPVATAVSEASGPAALLPTLSSHPLLFVAPPPSIHSASSQTTSLPSFPPPSPYPYPPSNSFRPVSSSLPPPIIPVSTFTFQLQCLLRAINGAALAILSPLAQSVLAANTAEELRGGQFGRFLAVAELSKIVVNYVIISAGDGWRWGYYCVFALSLVVLDAICIGVPAEVEKACMVDEIRSAALANASGHANALDIPLLSDEQQDSEQFAHSCAAPAPPSTMSCPSNRVNRAKSSNQAGGLNQAQSSKHIQSPNQGQGLRSAYHPNPSLDQLRADHSDSSPHSCGASAIFVGAGQLDASCFRSHSPLTERAQTNGSFTETCSSPFAFPPRAHKGSFRASFGASARSFGATVRVALRTPSFCVLVLQGVLSKTPWKLVPFLTLYWSVAGLSAQQSACVSTAAHVASLCGHCIGGSLGDAAARTSSFATRCVGANGRVLVAQASVLAGIPLWYWLLNYNDLLHAHRDSGESGHEIVSDAAGPMGVGTGSMATALISTSLFFFVATWPDAAAARPICAELAQGSDERATMAAIWLFFEGCLSSLFGPPLAGWLAREFGYALPGDVSESRRIEQVQMNATALRTAITLLGVFFWSLCAASWCAMYVTLPRDKKRPIKIDL